MHEARSAGSGAVSHAQKYISSMTNERSLANLPLGRLMREIRNADLVLLIDVLKSDNYA